MNWFICVAHNSKSQFMHQYSATMPKPRLVRQEAVQEEEDNTSTPRLGVHFLPTIPSAADSSIVLEDGDSNLCAMYTSALSTHSANTHPPDAVDTPETAEVRRISVQLNHVAESHLETIHQPPDSTPPAPDQPP